ncbi:unnamed protein product, partial [Linum tenue]
DTWIPGETLDDLFPQAAAASNPNSSLADSIHRLVLCINCRLIICSMVWKIFLLSLCGGRLFPQRFVHSCGSCGTRGF